MVYPGEEEEEEGGVGGGWGEGDRSIRYLCELPFKHNEAIAGKGLVNRFK